MVDGPTISMPDDFYDELKGVIVPIVVTGKDGMFEAIGTGFIVGAFGRQALMLSAAHNFDLVRRIDKPYSRHHPTSPFAVEEINVTLSKTWMRAAIRTQSEPGIHLASMPKVWVSKPLDIAVCALEFEDDVPQDVEFRSRLAIDSTPVKIGDRIAAVGYGGMATKEMAVDPFVVEMRQKLEWREGGVTNVFPGSRSAIQPWPCFQCDVPFDSGMSGGPIIAKRHGSSVVACGVISSDSSTGESHLGSGADAIAASLWPAMATVLDSIELDDGSKSATLLDLVSRNLIDDLGEAHKHVIIGAGEAGAGTYMWR